jgi:hypothetical protein
LSGESTTKDDARSQTARLGHYEIDGHALFHDPERGDYAWATCEEERI